jgi:hypothetical protein
LNAASRVNLVRRGDPGSPVIPDYSLGAKKFQKSSQISEPSALIRISL